MIEESQPQAEVLSLDQSGIRFGLDLAIFERWKAAISQEDAEGFVYYGGDVGLLKFVCAYDYLTNRKRSPQPHAIVAAYGAAFDVDPASYTCRVRAHEAFEHPAVQYLIEQFESAGLKAAKQSATPKFSKLLARVLDDGNKAETLGDAIKALDAGTRFMRMMQTESRERRTRPTVAAQPKPTRGKTIDAPQPALVDAARNAPEEEPEAE